MESIRCICGKEKLPGEENCCIYVLLYTSMYVDLDMYLDEYNRRSGKSLRSIDEITRDDIDIDLFTDDENHYAKSQMFRYDPIMHQIVKDMNLPVTLTPIRLEIFRRGCFDIDDDRMNDALIINPHVSEVISELDKTKRKLNEITNKYTQEKSDREKENLNFMLQMQAFLFSGISSDEKIDIIFVSPPIESPD